LAERDSRWELLLFFSFLVFAYTEPRESSREFLRVRESFLPCWIKIERIEREVFLQFLQRKAEKRREEKSNIPRKNKKVMREWRGAPPFIVVWMARIGLGKIDPTTGNLDVGSKLGVESLHEKSQQISVISKKLLSLILTKI